MYYSININQIAIINHNKTLNTNLDLIDGCLMEYLQKQSTSKFAQKNFIVKDNEVYFLICYDNIIAQLPLLNIQTKDAIGRRVKKLKELGIIKYFVDRKNNNKVYFNTTELFETFFSYNQTDLKPNPPVLKTERLTDLKPNHINDKNINDKNIKDTKEKNIKKENSFENDFIEFYKIYEEPKKEIDLTSQRINKIYKTWQKHNDKQKIIEGAVKYKQYLKQASWRPKKDIEAWLNAFLYEKDWEQELTAEQNKQKPAYYNKNQQPNLNVDYELVYREMSEDRKEKQIKDVDDPFEIKEIESDLPF